MIQIDQSMEIPGWLLGLVVFYLVLWIWSLIAVLSEKRKDREIEKLTWVIVLIFLPVLGVALYAAFGPGGEITEEEEKNKENEREAPEL
jgi:uncharacterized membrane protein YhaH (DUF805 family)